MLLGCHTASSWMVRRNCAPSAATSGSASVLLLEDKEAEGEWSSGSLMPIPSFLDGHLRTNPRLLGDGRAWTRPPRHFTRKVCIHCAQRSWLSDLTPAEAEAKEDKEGHWRRTSCPAFLGACGSRSHHQCEGSVVSSCASPGPPADGQRQRKGASLALVGVLF